MGVVLKKLIIFVAAFLLAVLVWAEDFDYDFLRATQVSSLPGFIWTKWNKEKKTSYLIGYEDGYLNALAYHVDSKDLKHDAVSKLPSFYDTKNSARDSLIMELDNFYKQHDKNINIPIPLAIRIITYLELRIKSHVNDAQLKFFENMMDEAVSVYLKDDMKSEVRSST